MYPCSYYFYGKVGISNQISNTSQLSINVVPCAWGGVLQPFGSEMMTAIGPDIVQPGSVVLYQRRRSPKMATDRERERPKERCLDVAKRNLLQIGGTEYKEGKSSPQRKVKPE